MQFNQTSAFRGTSEHTKIDKLETGNILNCFSPDEQKLIITNINEIVKGKLFFFNRVTCIIYVVNRKLSSEEEVSPFAYMIQMLQRNFEKSICWVK